jgi:hypothetical protein
MTIGRNLPRWAAVLAGVGTAVVGLALVAGLGFGIAWLASFGATRAERALAALLWFGVGAVLAFAAGGWLAARVTAGRGPGPALATGAAVGVVTLLLLVALIEAVLGETMDFRSVGVALGLVDVAAGAEVVVAPVPLATPAGGAALADEAAEIARRRTVTAAAYWGAVAALVLGAATLGGWAGAGQGRSAAPGRR